MSDINILVPEREIVIAGERIVVREYSLYDAMQMHVEITALSEQLADLFIGENEIKFADAERVIMKNGAVTSALISCVIDKPVKWVNSLGALDGMMLIDYWWSVNAGFFVNAAARKLYIKASGSNGGESSPNSSSQDTVQNASNTTQNAK